MRYFAYGSNLHPERLRRRTPSVSLVSTRELRGWRLSFEKRGRDGSGKATIIETGSIRDVVYGAVYDMQLDEKPVLDRIEGLNIGYHEHRLSLTGIGDVWTYRAETEYTHSGLAPFRWYRELVLLGARYHGFPGNYIDSIRRLAVAEDPDPARCREHGELIETMRGSQPDPTADEIDG